MAIDVSPVDVSPVRSPPPLQRSPASDGAAYLRALLVPAALVAAAVALHVSGLDKRLTDQFFDTSSGLFPRRSDPLLELVGHGMARSFALLVWFGVLAVALASLRVIELRAYRTTLWPLVTAMALGPLVVVVLKDITSFPCPWNLKGYGGFAAEPTTWFVLPRDAGRCFPSGHSAGGFSFLAFYFAAMARRQQRLARVALLFAVAAGSAFSIVRLVQGAHFLSHALWAAAIDWLLAALVFLPSTLGPRPSSLPAAADSPWATGDADGAEAAQ